MVTGSWIILLYAGFFAARGQAAPPRLSDPQLELTLFAEDPEIVTPIGMAIDPKDRVFVIESHTHMPPSDYKGPKGDRIKVLVDKDNDGRADSTRVFASDIQQAMNLAFSPDGELFVVCARTILRLIDHDGDLVCDEKQVVAKLLTKQRYPHNSLLSLTFDRSGWMYVGRGNMGGDHYRFQGSDESYVEGYGDGGSVIRLRPDGTSISEYATGFWNPFDLKFDRRGRLLLVDNDPDARGPNRLLEVIQEGDYGFKKIFGGAGTHPFQGWDGTLPGSLGYIAGTGEAPSGLIDCRRSSLPIEYERSVLATIWNENTIERFELSDVDTSLVNKSIFMSGDQDFRPVALDSDSRGNLYITDWVLVDYPNHGRGKIWRVSTKSREKISPEKYFAPYQANARRKRIKSLLQGEAEELTADWFATQKDPAVWHAAMVRLATDNYQQLRHELSTGNERQRMASLLASKRARPRDTTLIRQWLADSDADVRRAAVMWASETMDPSLRDRLDQVLSISPVTPELFESYLAATELLHPEFISAYKLNRDEETNQISSKKLPRKQDASLLVRLAKTQKLPDEVRALAIRNFDGETQAKEFDWIQTLLSAQKSSLAIAALQVVGHFKGTEDDQGIVNLLVEIARDPSRDESIRLHAIAAMTGVQDIDEAHLKALLSHPSERTVIQTRRSFRSHPMVRAFPSNELRPSELEDWRVALAIGGDSKLGRHVFFDSRLGCAKCHSLDGRGATLGPSLAGIAKSKTRKQIVDAVLEPSAQFAPQYQAWMVLDVEGQVHRGLQLDHGYKGAISMTLESGKEQHFSADDIEAYRALPTSLMPDGLIDLMTVREAKDLIAFLSTLGETP